LTAINSVLQNEEKRKQAVEATTPSRKKAEKARVGKSAAAQVNEATDAPVSSVEVKLAKAKVKNIPLTAEEKNAAALKRAAIERQLRN